MNAEYKPTPEEESAQRRADNDREGQAAIAAALAESAEAVSKSASPVGLLGVVGGSLPVSSAETLCRDWQNREKSHRGCAAVERFSASGDMRHTYAADAYETCVAMLRRELARANLRQPEENTELTDAKRSV